MSRGCGGQKPHYTAADQEKLDALDDAYKNGLMTQDEYQEKLKELTAAAVADAGAAGLDESRFAQPGQNEDVWPYENRRNSRSRVGNCRIQH